MKLKEIITDADLQNCIYFQQSIKVYVDGALDDVCYVIDYDAKIVKLREGYFYLRCNIKMFPNNVLCR